VSLSLQQSDYFWADLLKQVDWYREHATPEIAERFVDTVQTTLHQLTHTPGMGRPRFADWPELKGIRSFRVQRPFNRSIVFYRHDAETLFAERLIHGTRDLPGRLMQSPYEID
jgi:plasmid stabilization system protein ParE